MIINKKRTSLFLLFSSILCVLILYVVGYLLCAPNQVDIGDIPVELKANGKSVTFKSKTGKDLSGWLIQGHADKAGVLLMHGVRSNRLQMVDRAIFLNNLGYTVLLFDFQGHGESSGDNITFGYLESKDAEGAFNFLESQITNKKIGVIGVSLGGAATLLGDVIHKADALVIEAVFSTLEEAVKNRIEIRLGEFGRRLSPLLTSQLKPRLGFDIETISPLSRMSLINCPVYVIAGEEDQHTKIFESEEMYEKINSTKQFWKVSGAAHQDFYRFANKTYEQNISDFFETYL